MHRFLKTAFLLAAAASCVSAQLPTLLSTADLPGWRLLEEKTVRGEELYGHINGGAELYLEYGFEVAIIHRWTFGNAELSMDAYRMITRESAFGIASQLRAPDAVPCDIGRWCWTRPGHMLLTRAEWCVALSIRGEDADTATLNRAALTVLKRIHGLDIEPPAPFQRPPLKEHEHDIRYVCGPAGLQNTAPEWIDFFDGSGNFRMHILDVNEEKESYRYAIVAFPDGARAEAFARRAGFRSPEKSFKSWDSATHGKKRRALRLIFGTTAIVVEAEGNAAMFNSLLKKLPVL